MMITVHQGEYLSEEQADLIVDTFEAEGADLTRVILAHSAKFFVEKNLDRLILDPDSWGLRLGHARRLLEQGLNISIDLFGFSWDVEDFNRLNPTDWQQMAGLVALINEGYARQIVLGTDTFLKIQLRSYGGEGYGRLTKYVVPTLRKLEIPEADIRQITEENPRRLLSY